MPYLNGSSVRADSIGTQQHSTPRPASSHPAPEITGLGHGDVHSKKGKKNNPNNLQTQTNLQTTKKLQCF